MRRQTLKIDGSGTIFSIKLETGVGKFKAMKSVSIYPDSGMLKVYVEGSKVIEIPIEGDSQ